MEDTASSSGVTQSSTTNGDGGSTQVAESTTTSVTSNDGGTPTSAYNGNTVGRAHIGQDEEVVDVATEIKELIKEKEDEIKELEENRNELKDAYDKSTDPAEKAALEEQAKSMAADQKMNAYELKALKDYGYPGSLEDEINNSGRLTSGTRYDDLSGDEKLYIVNRVGPQYIADASGLSSIMPEMGPSDLIPGEALAKMAVKDLVKLLNKFRRSRAFWKKVRERIKELKKKRALRRCKPCPKKGQPVFAISGQVVSDEPGFFIAGTIDLDLSSTFLSDLETITGLGRNRISPIDATIARDADGRLKLVDEALFPVHFRQPRADPGSWEESETSRQIQIAATEKRGLLLREDGVQKTFHKYEDGIWRIVRIDNLKGSQLILSRRLDGVLEKIDHPDGLSLVFDHDARGYRTAVHLVASNGEPRTVMRYAYDLRGNMVSVDAFYSGSMRFTYDEHDRIVDVARGYGYCSRRTYDDKGRVVATYSNGPHDGSRFFYDDELNIATYLPLGDETQLTKYYYDSNKVLFAEANALGHIKRNEYDETGALRAEIDAEGNRTEYSLDHKGYIKSIRDAEGRETLYYRDSYGNLEMVFDAAYNVWDYEYDPKGNLTAIISPLGHRTDVVNNEKGQPVGIMRHDGLLEQRSYDGYNLLASIVDFRGQKTEFERDLFGRIVAIRDPLGHVTKLEYEDQQGQDFWEPARVVRPDGVVTMKKVGAGIAETVVTDGEGRAVTYRQGFGVDNNLLTEVTDSNGGKLKFFYDGLERLEKVQNQKGLFWSFERDGAGRVIRETDFDGLVVEYAYDKADRLIETRYADGARLCYAYDKSGLLLQEELYEPGAEKPSVMTYGYDERGLLKEASNEWALVELERDKLGHVVSESVNGRKIQSAYDCCGNRIKREIGGQLLEARYDPLGAIERLTIGEHAPLEFSRDALGRELRRASAFGFSLEQRFDAVGQLLKQAAGRVAAGAFGVASHSKTPYRSLVERNYSWSKAFEPVCIADGLWGETSYAYDHNGQVTDTRFGDGGGERFSYDSALNIVGSGDAAGGDGGLRFEGWLSSAGGRVKAGRGPNGEKIFLQHDLRGRVVERRVECDGFRPKVWRYRWDGKGRLVCCMTPKGETWRYGYDAFGRRLFKRRDLNEDESRFFAHRFPSVIERAAYEKYNYSISYLNERPRSGLGSDPAQDDGRPPVVGVSYLWDGDVVAEEAPLRLDGTVDWEASTRWHYEPETFRPLAKEEPSGENGGPGRLLYIVNDHLGTPREMFTERGELVWAASYTTWGVVRGVRAAPPKAANNDGPSPNWGGGGGRLSIGFVQGNLAIKPASQENALDCPIRFQGQWQDEESGLYYNRFRYFDALSGQYISPDTVGLLGGTRSSGYVANPMIMVDRLGLAPTTWQLNNGVLCIKNGFQPGSAAHTEMQNYGSQWNNRIQQKGGTMTRKKLTPQEQKDADRWRRDYRKANPSCCGSKRAGHVPDTAAGNDAYPPLSQGMTQMRETNEYLAGVISSIPRGTSYSSVKIVDSLSGC